MIDYFSENKGNLIAFVLFVSLPKYIFCMKKTLYSLLFSLAIAGTAYAQQVSSVATKMDRQLQRLLQTQPQRAEAPTLSGKKAMTDTVLHVIIKAADSRVLADSLRGQGHRATVITPQVLTAELPLSSLTTTASHPLCRFINSSRRHKAKMSRVRAAVRADEIHQGQGLDTPYKGEGVIVAVIDQGFQGHHAAFADETGKSRVIASWNRGEKGSKPILGPLVTDSDGMDEVGGHGTHVTNTAAGSDKGNGLYGIAPKSDIIMVPSNFDDAELLEDLVFIDSIARAAGKPYVVNMSFGSTVGPHDGTTDYDLAANWFVDGKEGRIFTAAMGNDGDGALHVHHRFTQDNDTVHLLVKPNAEHIAVVDIWGQKTDSLSHLKVIPYLQSPTTKDAIPFKNNRAASLRWLAEISPNNKKQVFSFAGKLNGLSRRIPQAYLYVKIIGNAGDEFHAWVNENQGSFETKHDVLKHLLIPDNDYCVGEGAASIPEAIAVGSYTTALDWEGLDGKTYNFQGYENTEKGQISYFSSHGPSLGTLPKPTIIAPGAIISSAYNRFDAGFKDADPRVVSKVTESGKTDYYGIMQGTSMASPAVAGVVALWLQANPKLTSKDVRDILKKTAVKDNHTGKAAWSHLSGYGKIDAYAGLKEALTRVSAIDAVYQSTTPVTISSEAHAWRLLFGSHESDVRVEVLTLSGKSLLSRSLGAVHTGEEVLLHFSSYPAGVYLLRIVTPRATIVRKVVK